MAEISSNDTKIWLDVNIFPPKPTFVDPYKSTHSDWVYKNPTDFRLPADYFITHKAKYDYDGYIMLAAMRNNFVRIALDFRYPDTKSNIEAISMKQLQIAANWLNEFINTGLKRVILVQRKSELHTDAKVYVLENKEQVEFFIKWGKVLQDKF